MGNLTKTGLERFEHPYRRSKMERIIDGEIPAEDGHVFDGADLEVLSELVAEDTSIRLIALVLNDAGFAVSYGAVYAYLTGSCRGSGELWGSRRPTE